MRLREAALAPSCRSAAQEVSPPQRAVTQPDALSPVPILTCSGCSVSEADGAPQTGPTWPHLSADLSIHPSLYPSTFCCLQHTGKQLTWTW